MGPSWLLVSYRSPDGESVGAMLDDGSVVAIDRVPAGLSMLGVMARWAEFGKTLREWTPSGARPLTGGELIAPLRYPSKVACVGANYPGHRNEMSIERQRAQLEPFFFLKPPTSTIIGPGDTIQVDSLDDLIDWEAEVAVVIGTEGRHIRPEDALSHVAGYMLVNDITARARLRRAEYVSPGFEFDWLSAKARDTFLPTGPGILPSWFVGAEGIDFSLAVNGAQKQSSNIREMVVPIPQLIAELSAMMKLEPGDILATGTPEGVGRPRDEFLGDGDEVIVTSPTLGVLANTVRLSVRT